MKVLQTLSVDAFKALSKTSSFSIIESPKTHKLFVVSNDTKATVAAVSKNYDKSLPKEFIQVSFEDTAECIWVLHNSNSQAIETF